VYTDFKDKAAPIGGIVPAKRFDINSLLTLYIYHQNAISQMKQYSTTHSFSRLPRPVNNSGGIEPLNWFDPKDLSMTLEKQRINAGIKHGLKYNTLSIDKLPTGGTGKFPVS